MRRPTPALPAPPPSPPPGAEPVEVSVSAEATDFAAVVEEARRVLEGALAREGVRDSDAHWFVGALAAAVAVLEAHGQQLQARTAEQQATFDRLLREAEDRLRGPMGPEERVLLRTELVRAAAGAIPGPEERAAFASSVVEAVRSMMPAPTPSPAVSHAPPASVQPDTLRQAAGAGARLAVAQALSPSALQMLTMRYAGWLAAAFACGAVFGAILLALLR